MFKNILLIIIITVLVYSCANKGYPSGGPKDITSPVMVKELPASFSTNFNEKRIKIYFNEYIQLKDIKKSLVVSPPLKHKPRVSNRGKYIVVDMSRDTLKENITYSIDFGYSIADNNEGNPLGYYRYVMSTGDCIDTMEMGGQVVDAETGIPYMGILVGLFKDHSDSIPLKSTPDFVAITDSSGMFHFTNIQDSSYKVVAFYDENSDYKYFPGMEPVGFIDTFIQPVCFDSTRIDTTYKKHFNRKNKTFTVDSAQIDTIIERRYTAYGPANLFIKLFNENKSFNFLEKPRRDSKELIDILFTQEDGARDLEIGLVDSAIYDSISSDWFFLERNLTNDTLKMWITDSLVYRRTDLKLSFRYKTKDADDSLIIKSDTFKMHFKEPVMKKISARDSIRKIYSTVTLKPSSSLDINKCPELLFETPVQKIDTNHIRLEGEVDSLKRRFSFDLEQDKYNKRKFIIRYDFKEDTKYKISVDSGCIHDIYGKPFSAITHELKVRKKDNYGNLKVTLSNVHDRPIILQLYKAMIPAKSLSAKTNKTSPISVVAEKSIRKDGDITFQLLKPGKYMLRAIIDSDENGEWDAGLYLDGKQPEDILYQYVEIIVKENFDIEQNFDLDEKYEVPIKKL